MHCCKHTHYITGQTTALDEPKPQGGWQRGGSGGGGQSSGASGAAGGDGYIDPRAEAPIEDKTGTYAAIGAGMGVFLGWASQFF